ncbi:MAG: chemotaxis protein CheW [Deltaproteobacteria bacterium]|nr:chemotaxis protein CheW [Deltaproteobacteria bacterium]
MSDRRDAARRTIDWDTIRARILEQKNELDHQTLSAAEIDRELRARAIKLARTERVAIEDRGREHLAFWIGRSRCAIDLALVGGVVTPRWITTLPTAPKRLSRVIQVQGVIVPVADLVEVLGVKADAEVEYRRAVLLKHGSRHLAILTHRAEDIVRLELDTLSSPERDAAGFIRGIAPDMTIVLDGETLLSSLNAAPGRGETPSPSPLKVTP